MKTNEQQLIRTAVKGMYDVQKIRIMTGQRIVAQFLAKLNLPPEPAPLGENATAEQKAEHKALKQERDDKIYDFCSSVGIVPKMDDSSKKKSRPKITDFLEVILRDYKGITTFIVDKHASIGRAIKSASIGVISDESEVNLLNSYDMLVKSEAELMKPIKNMVESHPLWTNFLKDVRGCGHLMAAVILSEFEIDKANYVSSFHKYAGLDTVGIVDDQEFIEDEEGNPTIPNPNYGKIIRYEGRGRKAAHLETMQYIDKHGNENTKKGISYNPFLKTKLLGVLAPSFIKCREAVLDADENPVIDEATGKKVTVPSYYGQVYYDYRNRLDNDRRHDDKKDAHKHAMAMRYMIKMFLKDLFVAWCLVTDRKPPAPYEVAYLGEKPHHKVPQALMPLLREKAPELIPTVNIEPLD